jgi:hypothetical protein
VQRQDIQYIAVEKFVVLVAGTVKITVLWGVTPCILVGRCQRFGGTPCRIPQDSNHIHCCENLEFQIFSLPVTVFFLQEIVKYFLFSLHVYVN